MLRLHVAARVTLNIQGIEERLFRANRLSYAELRGADLRHADLRAANLLDADLGKADLRGANLSSTRHLGSTVLRRARFDRTTQWPVGFDPDAAGAHRQPYV